MCPRANEVGRYREREDSNDTAVAALRTYEIALDRRPLESVKRVNSKRLIQTNDSKHVPSDHRHLRLTDNFNRPIDPRITIDIFLKSTYFTDQEIQANCFPQVDTIRA